MENVLNKNFKNLILIIKGDDNLDKETIEKIWKDLERIYSNTEEGKAYKFWEYEIVPYFEEKLGRKLE